jgi:hypothetical protein
MGSWKRVMWSEAGQVAGLLGWEAASDDAGPPESYFARLKGEGRELEAAMFLGQALPRLEAVAWAARTVRSHSKAVEHSPEAEALKSALLWLQDPSDNRRRAARAAAEPAKDNSPERMCAMAVFYSGGSLTPDSVPPVPAPKEVCGKFAAGAVIMACASRGSAEGALAQALDAGEALARGEAAS